MSAPQRLGSRMERTIEVDVAAAIFVRVADHLVDVVFGQVAAQLLQDPPTRMNAVQCSSYNVYFLYLEY